MTSSEREVTPAEQVLRQAKEVVHALGQIQAQIERGATGVDVNEAQTRLHETMARMQLLAQGAVPPSSSGSGAASASPSVAPVVTTTAAVHSRQAGTQVVTEMQRRRAQQVLSELQLSEQVFERYARRTAQRGDHASQVEELLGTYGTARTDFSALDELERERKALQYSRKRMQQMSAESDEVLAALQSQGRRMGGVGGKMADMLESLGVSNTTILQIVRRNQMDAWLVYGGILFMIVFMWYIW